MPLTTDQARKAGFTIDRTPCSVLYMATRVIDYGCYVCQVEGMDSGPYEYADTVVRHGDRLKIYRCVDRKACAKRQAESRRADIADHLFAIRERRDDLASLRRSVADTEAEIADRIRRALAAGAGATETSRAAGISRERVYQIRDSRR